VAAYDAKARVDLDAALELLRRNGLGSDTTLVDLGCGTGVPYVRDEHGTYSWLLEALPEQAGFEVHEREIRRGVYVVYVCGRR
jgi:hypothetical protein